MRRKSDLGPIERIMKRLNEEASEYEEKLEYFTKRLTEAKDDQRPVIEWLLNTEQQKLVQVTEEIAAMNILIESISGDLNVR